MGISFWTGVRLPPAPPKRNDNFRQESCRFFFILVVFRILTRCILLFRGTNVNIYMVM